MLINPRNSGSVRETPFGWWWWWWWPEIQNSHLPCFCCCCTNLRAALFYALSFGKQSLGKSRAIRRKAKSLYVVVSAFFECARRLGPGKEGTDVVHADGDRAGSAIEHPSYFARLWILFKYIRKIKKGDDIYLTTTYLLIILFNQNIILNNINYKIFMLTLNYGSQYFSIHQLSLRILKNIIIDSTLSRKRIIHIIFQL